MTTPADEGIAAARREAALPDHDRKMLETKALCDLVKEQIDSHTNPKFGDVDHIRRQLLNILIGGWYQGGEDEADTEARIIAEARRRIY